MEGLLGCELMGNGSTVNHIQSDCNEKEMDMSNKTKQLHFNFIKFQSSPEEALKEEAEKLHQLMNISTYCLIEEVDQRKKDEYQIMHKLWCASYTDKQIEWKTKEVMFLEGALGKPKPDLPMRPIPRTAGYLHLTEKDVQTPVVVCTDRKRLHKRLKKERMNFGYMQQVKEELLSAMKSSAGRPMHGTQELNDAMESLVQRIQHGNNNRAEETKLIQEIRFLKETIEKYTAPTKPDPRNYRRCFDVGGSKRKADDRRRMQHKLNIRQNDVEELKRDQMGNMARVTRLKAEFEFGRKNIRCMERELENINSRRMKVYKWACKLGEQKNKISRNSEYQLLITHVKELAGKGDVMGIRQLCDRQVEDFKRKWAASSKVFELK